MNSYDYSPSSRLTWQKIFVYLTSMLLTGAGLSLSPYYQFLRDQKSVLPAMNARGYVDVDGNFYGRDEDSRYAERLRNYNYLVYDNLFDSGRKDNWFYQ